MKKIILPLLVIIGLNSCDVYKPASQATCVKELAQNPFVQNIAKRLISDLGSMLVKQGLNIDPSKINLKTPLNTLLSNANAINGFKGLLTDTYKVPTALVDNNYSKWGNIGSVVGFLADNANFNF